jgi:hypothetical protein
VGQQAPDRPCRVVDGRARTGPGKLGGERFGPGANAVGVAPVTAL